MKVDGIRYDSGEEDEGELGTLAMIGVGVVVRRSSLEFDDPDIDPGQGLFATRSFSEGEVITEYGGQLVPPHEVAELILEDSSQMVVSFQTSDWAVDGRAQGPVDGMPGGQFANDARSDRNNSVYFETTSAVEVPLHRKKWKGEARYSNRIWLLAIGEIRVGDEVLVDYDEGYWLTHDPDLPRPK